MYEHLSNLSEQWELCLLFFGVALVYASVGFGGGSSYLAFLALYNVDYLLTRSTSLLCNVVVVSAGTYIFFKNKHLDLRRALPLTLASVPLAFLGGLVPLKEATFFLILAITLIVAAVATWVNTGYGAGSSEAPPQPAFRTSHSVLAGAGIGFLSGMVGIGGGIFLAPLLYLGNWAASKTIAATCSFFILVNSIAGLAGQMLKPDFHFDWDFALPLLLAVFLGGQIGSRLGAVHLPPLWVRRATALLILYVGAKLLMKYW